MLASKHDMKQILITIAAVVLVGCGLSSSGTHTVSTDQDRFEREINGRKIEYRNWIITVDDNKKIPIEKKKSTIKIDSTALVKVYIFVNEKQVYDE